MNTIIRTHNLSKYFSGKASWRTRQSIKAVDSVTLEVRRGELFGLVGPNKAGKTTLIKLLCTLVLPTSGSAVVNGFPITSHQDRVKASIGLVTSEERSFYWRLTCRQNLQFFSALYGLTSREATGRIDELMAMLEIAKDADTRFQNCSSGIKQRMGIARSLLNDPPVLFMDEALRSLDPHAAYKLKVFIRKDMVEERKKTVILTTHQMAEAEEMCDRIAVMQDGAIRASGTMRELRQHAGAADADLGELFRRITGSGNTGFREETGICA